MISFGPGVMCFSCIIKLVEQEVDHGKWKDISIQELKTRMALPLPYK